VKFLGATVEELEGSYPSAEEARVTVAVVHAARLVRERNAAHVWNGRAPAVSAAFEQGGIVILDPYEASGPVVERIPCRPL